MSQEKRPYLDINVILDMIALGQIDTVEKVLNASPGYDVNQKDKYGNFPAILAAERNSMPLLRLLVKHGARLDQKDGLGRTVTGWAQKYNNQEMIEFIEKTLASSSENLRSKHSNVSEDTSSPHSNYSSDGGGKSPVKGH